ncbi:MAG TPA: GNAT family N-acetyltransferase [Kofleriaceae bacterium]|jgi:RimJ/RimL family protein N-acetyltransferase|nr:GNAT family N-acetyltransferase [Kofleriaceae bacterium]
MTIQLRIAEDDDCDRVYTWNFAPDARAHSNRPEAVELDRHYMWFFERVERPAFWIIELDGEPVGNVRIDNGLISIALASHARGQGVGRAAITRACEEWDAPVTAKILPGNLASRTAFEACGFVAADATTYYWSPE